MKKRILLSLLLVSAIFTSCNEKNEKEKNEDINSNPNVVVDDSKDDSVNDSKNVTIVPEQMAQNSVATNEITSQEDKISVPTEKVKSNTEIAREKHAKFLANSPFKKVANLTKSERKAMGITPNKYYENEWELTMDPTLGRPTPEKLRALKVKLEKDRQDLIASGRVPGDATDNNWVERGPTNVGGRVRAIMFDPTDATYETVFAGGVSGGLWKNTNISNANSTWTRVDIPENLAVTCITSDPNNTSTFYVGTGESYVAGDVNGDGVWKSTNAGLTWTKVLGGISGATTFQASTSVTITAPANIAGDYITYETTAFGTAITVPITNNIVLVNDGSGSPTEGCVALTNAAAINGKIALIRRGNCTFVEKVKFAQDAGAVAVIMMNNAPGTPVAMGGTDATITIPSVMISKTDGDMLEAALGSGAVTGTLNPSNGGFTGNLVPGIQHVNDLKIRNNGGVSEIYVAAGDSFYGTANATTYMGGTTYGLYKSTNGGSTWTEVSLPLTAAGKKHCPNDIEIGSTNKVYVSTIKSTVWNDGGGVIFSSTDGNTFTQKHVVADGDRTQIAVSKTTADKVYVLAELTAGGVTMVKTLNDFGSTSAMTLPADADTGIAANDFCRGQAFYDLLLEIDPANDQILYAGGIDLFRTANGGTTWSQISKWSNNNNLAALTCSLVHADQHALAFKPGNSNIALFGNDGGVFYASNLSTAATSNVITSRNKGLNVTQFYTVGVAPTGATGGDLVGDYIIAGAQDNGTQYFASVNDGQNTSVSAQGGDGAYSFFDQGADKYYITNYVHNQSINYRPVSGAVRIINSETTSNGAFICPMALDSSLDILYADYTAGTTYQIRRYKNLKSGTVNKTLLFNPLMNGSPTAITVSKYTTASTTMLVGTRNGKLLRVTNAHLTAIWSDITGPGFIGSVSDVEYGASENEIFVTMHNYNVTSVWYSSDAGVTWQNKEGNLPDLPVKCILKNPLLANEVIIGTELGVWYTTNFNDASPVWNQAYNGMRNVKVTDLDLRNDNKVFASTYGRGVFSGMFTNTTLSANDFANEQVSIYPNPTNGVVKINIPNYFSDLNIKVYDLNGREILKQNVPNFNLESSIDLSGKASGFYVLKIEGENLNFSKKIMLN